MLALLRFARRRLASGFSYFSKLWNRVLYSIGVTPVKSFKTNITQFDAPNAATLKLDSQGFPTTTNDQRKAARNSFIESIDLDAVCALASSYRDGKPCKIIEKKNGSFNVCFFVQFDQDGLNWVVRIPIESALDNLWDKLLSEVTTMQ